MNVALLIMMLCPLVSSGIILFSKMKGCLDTNQPSSDRTAVYVVPYDATAEDVKKYQIINETGASTIMAYPDKSTLMKTDNINSETIRVCLKSDETEGMTSATAKVYLSSLNVTVYQAREENETFTVEAGETEYVVVFSKSSDRVTIQNLTLGKNTEFTLYAGLPVETGEEEDPDEAPIELFVYNANFEVGTFYVPEDHFHLKVTSGSFTFDVVDGGESPLEKVFESDGFLLSKGFPKAPSEEYKNVTLKLVPKQEDTKVSWQITAGSAGGDSKTDTRMTELASETKSGVTISCGGNEITVLHGSSIEWATGLPANTTSFQVSATTGYSIQFNIEEPPKEMSTTTKVVPTTRSCPVCTCPTTPSITTSTEPTTTRSASRSAGTFVLTLVSLYALV